MSAIVADMSVVTTAILAVVTSAVSTIVATPLLLIGVLMGLVGSGVMLFRKLRHG